jgi:peptide/nickel transport system substrate-binding protein
LTGRQQPADDEHALHVPRHTTGIKNTQLLRGCLAGWLAIVATAAGCDGPPARPKHWRHAQGAAAEPAGADPAQSLATWRPPTKDPERAHTLRIRLQAEPAGINLLREPDREALQIAEDSVYETLLQHHPSGYVPLLAESFRVVGGTEIQLTLRDGVTFHDGRPFGAADALASIEAARALRSPSSRLPAALADVTSISAWGSRELRITLRRENGYVLRALAEVPMLPAQDLAARVPPGTGPYRVAAWTRGERVVLERHPGYWGPAAAIPVVEFLFIGDGALALAMAKRGEIDVLPALIPEHWPAQASAPGVVDAFAPLDLAPPRFLAIALNLRRPPFDDARVRRATAMLVDRPRLAREAWRGLARPVGGPIWPGGIGDGGAPPPPPFDPVRAMHLLDQAGWRAEKDGVRARAGVKLRITLLGAGAQADPERELIVSGLRRGGFAVDVRLTDPARFLERVRDVDAAVIDYRGRVDEDLSPFFATDGARNLGGLSSPAVDATLDALRRVWQPAARRPLVTQLATLLAAEMPLVPLVAPTPHGLVSRRVAGVTVHDGWFRLRDLHLR